MEGPFSQITFILNLQMGKEVIQIHFILSVIKLMINWVLGCWLIVFKAQNSLRNELGLTIVLVNHL